MDDSPASTLPQFPITTELVSVMSDVSRLADETWAALRRKLISREYEVITEDVRITLRELHARSLDGEGFVGEKIIRDAVTDYLAPHRRAAATYPLLVRLLGEPDSTPWATSLPQAYHVRALTNALMELVKFEPSLVETIVWHHREAAYCARKLGGEREASFFGVFGWVTPEACASQRLEALARLADRLKSRYRELWWHEYVAKEWSRL